MEDAQKPEFRPPLLQLIVYNIVVFVFFQFYFALCLLIFLRDFFLVASQMYTVSKNKNDYFYYLVKLRRCTKIETLIIRLSVLGVQNRFQLSRTFLQLCNFLAPPSVSRVNYTRIRLLSMRGYLRSALYLYNSVVSWFIAQLSRARALLCASTLKDQI